MKSSLPGQMNVSTVLSNKIALIIFVLILVEIAFELRHEISNNVVYATSKASDQPAHKRSLIRTFASQLNILVLSY